MFFAEKSEHFPVYTCRLIGEVLSVEFKALMQRAMSTQHVILVFDRTVVPFLCARQHDAASWRNLGGLQLVLECQPPGFLRDLG